MWSPDKKLSSINALNIGRQTHDACSRYAAPPQEDANSLAPDYWTLVLSSRILRFFRSLGYRIELILYLFATSGANESTSFWKRGSFRSGSNIRSSRSNCRGERHAHSHGSSYGIEKFAGEFAGRLVRDRPARFTIERLIA